MVSSDQTEAEERLAADDLDEYCPVEENTLEMEEQNHPSDIGEGNIIVIEDKWILFRTTKRPLKKTFSMDIFPEREL